MKIIFILLLSVASLLASEFGTLSLFVLKNGKPLGTQHLTIVNTKSQKSQQATTDGDGYFYTKLLAGTYQIRLLARDNKATPQAFVRKNVVVEANKDSQVIVSLKADNTTAFIDTEAPKVAKTIVKKRVVVQNGTLLLTLLSGETKKKVANATVFVKGSNIEAKSNASGSLTLTLPVGKHTLSIIHPDYSAQTLNVNILAKETISKEVSLSPASMELDEFVVLAPHVEGSVAASISQEKNSDAVGNVLGSEQFSKSGDSSVAGALKRVSGITIVGGKYVYVRGLGDRYSTVLLNGLHVPSPEPTKRVVPLDIFPTSVVESITIQKSYTGDLPASFGGGTVLIKSKEIPKNSTSYVKLGIEVLANDATGKKVLTNSTNSHPLPSSAMNGGNNVGGPAVTNDVRTYRTLDPQSTTLAPGMKIELSGGKSYEVSKNLTLGASATVYYKNNSDSNDVTYNKFFYDINSKKIYHDSSTKAVRTTFLNEYSGMLNIGATYYKDNSIKYTYFTTSQTKDTTQTSSIDYTGDTDDREKTYYEYVERTLTAHQISGKNNLHFANSTDGYLDNLVIEYAGESAEATRDEPGTVEINYLHQSSGVNWDRKNWYYSFLLNDKVTNYRTDFTLPFKFNENDNYTKAGVFIYNKTRDFDSRRFKMRSTNFDDMQEDMDTIYKEYKDDLDFSASYRNSDSYSASQDVTAFYLKQLFSVTHNFDFVASLRQESSSQQLKDSSQTYAPLKTSDLFPSIGLTYRFNDDNMQMRFAYATSISRPDFREFSNTRYKDPVTENIVFGNPELKVTYINHLDFKYEWYLSADEIFSTALFAKEFSNPIEKVVKLDDSQDNIFQETYQNADSATSYGVEMDYRKRFGFIDKSLENVLFGTNIALIKSEIKLNNDPDNDFTSRLTSKKRAMQGQSPYVVNVTFGYDNSDSGNSALFLFNQIGKRIVSLGTDNNKDTYQEPFSKLDFVWKYKLSPKKENGIFGYALGFKVKNLLDSEVKFTQGGETTASTKPGRAYSLKLDIKY